MDYNRIPFSIVWTPLPLITWLFPIIGHTGITDSEGKIYDFGGSYYVAIDNFTFGNPTKYLTLDPVKAGGADQWDEAIMKGADKYRNISHNIVSDNCHDHVADTLNYMCYDGKKNYNQFSIFLMMTFKSSYCGFSGFIKQWFLIITICIVLSIFIIKSLL